jgi:carboxypeptidase N regulatory subunit
LSLGYNQISELPTGIFDSLTGLNYLYLYDNQISELPDGIFDSLTALNYLELSSNQLTEIDLSGLTNLRDLDL